MVQINYEIYKGHNYPTRLIKLDGMTAKIACEELYNKLQEVERTDRFEAEIIDMGILCYFPTNLLKYLRDDELIHIINSQRMCVMV